MTRNVVAVVGSASGVSDEVRCLAESLARALSEAGFDLVTGGMGGVMRAVACGHRTASTGTNLIHVEPGWGRPWERNPHPAGIVRTGLGAIRNHIVVRSADLVVGVSGGAGTLSEVALAWQEGTPTAVLRGAGGWAARLADTALDDRRGDWRVVGCDTVEEVLAWATSLRPEGAYLGRANRGFYPLEVPAIHRVHWGEPDPVHRVHLRYGMSLEYGDLVSRLRELNDSVERWNVAHAAETVALVTFDDGWEEVTQLTTVFDELPCLCPVLFVGENHFLEEPLPLPLQRLYQHCAELGVDPEDRSVFGVSTRSGLKKMPEREQHEILDAAGVDRMAAPAWLLNPSDIASLRNAGWVVASHGQYHEDLPKRLRLGQELTDLADRIEQRSHMPWLCWPEGRWSPTACEHAKHAGFHYQFGICSPTAAALPEGMVMRRIWWPKGFVPE